MDPVSEDAVFEAVRAAVEAGEYTEWLPAARAQGRSRGAADGLPARNAPGGQGYLRGTPEHLQARALGLVARLPQPPLATAEAVWAVEEATGCPLPPLLRRLFLEVANGGFGPRHGGILGAPGCQGGEWEDLLHVHRAFGSEPDPQVPRHMLWLYDWGCCIWSLVDCSSPEGVMWVWEPHSDGEHWTKSLFCQGIFLSEWLAAWLEGRLRQPEITQDVMPNIPGQLTLFNDPGTASLSYLQPVTACPEPDNTIPRDCTYVTANSYIPASREIGCGCVREIETRG
jgi:hypothetical protein